MKEVDFLTVKLGDKLINDTKKLKYKAIFAIMLDAGLRISETLRLQIQDFDFKDRLIIVKSLKKRGLEKGKIKRQIPMTNRIYDILAEYLSSFKEIKGETYLFPSDLGNEPHISRKTVWYYLNEYGKQNPEFTDYRMRPHLLRHTFATEIVTTGTPIHEAQKLLGHASMDTTAIYTHLPIEVMRRRLGIAKPEKTTFIQKLRNLWKPKKKIYINLTQHEKFTVGRKNELEILALNAEKRINTILIGSIGVGKSHLLRSIAKGQKMILIDDTSDIKNTLIGILLYLYEGDKDTLKRVIYPNYGKIELQKHLTKQSIKSLCEEIVKITAKLEYTLLIDSVDSITPKAVKTLEFLKDHFCILTSAREVPVSRSSFLWNFDRVKVPTLNRLESLEMIHKLSYDLKVPDFDIFKNHIFEQTNGNPRAIFEMIDRYRKEPFLTKETIKNITHFGALPEIDMTAIVLLVFGSLVILRYLAAETGEESLKFIGGLAFILLLLGRYFLRFTKRKFV